MKTIIGIDIGGTNTDGVLIDENKKIIKHSKVNTSDDIASGFEKCLINLLSDNKNLEVTSIIVGTTHATNAILRCIDLYKVGVIRLAGQYPISPPPCFDWPDELSKAVLGGYATIAGGYECSGEPIKELNIVELQKKVKELLKLGVESIAVTGVFSPMNHSQELEVEKIIKIIVGPTIPISLSHKISGVGYLERENSTILNAALKKVMKKGFNKLKMVLKKLNITSSLYITQNNGSRIDLNEAIEYPILTLSAGPTNSFVGALSLCKISDAIIVDIGGTSTDIGLIKNGVPRRSLNTSDIGGVKLNLSMPDVVSLAVGGGSYVSLNPNRIGPKSVGRNILSSLSLGGSQLTLTDIALKSGHIKMKNSNHNKVLITKKEADKILKEVISTIEKNVSLLTADDKIPIILVGGGALLLPKKLLSKRYIIPDFASVANALGAALSDISTTLDVIVSVTNQSSTLNSLKLKTVEMLKRKEVLKDDIVISDIQIIPYHYVPNNMARVIVTARGKSVYFEKS